jgi:hypothetical protein
MIQFAGIRADWLQRPTGVGSSITAESLCAAAGLWKPAEPARGMMHFVFLHADRRIL